MFVHIKNDLFILMFSFCDDDVSFKPKQQQNEGRDFRVNSIK